MKYTYATLPVVGEYDGLVKDQKVRITGRAADSELCQGRTNGAGWSFHGGSCSYKGKHVHENVMVETVENGETTVDVRTVRFCGTHDPIKYAERKRDEYLAERKRAESDEHRRQAQQKRVDEMVAEINELAGGKVVESGWASSGPSVRLYSPQSLLDALRTLTGNEERIAS